MFFSVIISFYGHRRELHVLTHSFPTRRSSDLRVEDSSSVRRPLNFFIDDARYTFGKAVYLTDFTPPTTPLTVGTQPPSLVVEVFQMSEVVGRGRGSGQTTITL